MSEKKPKIKPLPNGPYMVKGLKDFTNSRGEPIDTKDSMALCRCGRSKLKPFCDGTHISVGFTDSKKDTRVPDKRDDYKGKKITIHDNRGICSHAAHCTDNLPEVFQMGVEPWIDSARALPAEIKRVIGMCPSGALGYSQGSKEHSAQDSEKDTEPEIHISKNGPYHVRGGVELEGVDLGDGAARQHYTLCRCGASGNKPRCDGSHWYAAFKDDEAMTISAANRALEGSEPQWIKVAEPGELEDGEIKPLEIMNQQIVLSRVADNYGAIDGVCPHQGGPLMEGILEDGVLRCPWHGHAFDPITGKSLGTDPDAGAFEVEARDDGIYLKAEAPSISRWTFSHVMAETMVEWGIKHVFGMVGHSNLGMAEAIRVQEQKGRLKYIGIRHEGAAAFACSGYAKVSGVPAACLTIAGPGATNLLTGLWDAKMDRAPVLALTGQISTEFIGSGAFQEIDMRSAFHSVAAFSKVVLPGSNPAELMSLAIKNAIVQRDVAHLIIPNEVQILDAQERGPAGPDGRLSDTAIAPSTGSVDLAMCRVNAAKRPVIITGHGVRQCMEDILAFAEKLGAPVLTTYKAKGFIPDSHPLACGVLGKSGTPVSSWFMNNSDLLIVFGASFSQHTGIDQNKPLIQVDFDQMSLGKFHCVDNPILGDTGITARMFFARLAENPACSGHKAEIADKWEHWRTEKKRRADIRSEKGLNPAFIFHVLKGVAPDNAIMSLDVGNSTYSFGRYFECSGHRVLLSGYLGSIGFSFPAAMGAFMAQDLQTGQYGQNGRKVISISGDGGFAQYMVEFNTAVKYKMDITHVLLNNGELAKISKEQRDGHWPVWETGLSNPGFAEYAKVCGGLGLRVEAEDQLEDALGEALAYKGPALVEIISDPGQT